MDPGTGTLVVSRPRGGWRDFARSYRIEVDGRRCGGVRRGRTLTLSLPAGRHVVCARIDWMGSPVLLVDVPAGSSVTCRVEPAGGAWSAGWHVASGGPWLKLSLVSPGVSPGG